MRKKGRKKKRKKREKNPSELLSGFLPAGRSQIHWGFTFVLGQGWRGDQGLPVGRAGKEQGWGGCRDGGSRPPAPFPGHQQHQGGKSQLTAAP